MKFSLIDNARNPLRSMNLDERLFNTKYGNLELKPWKIIYRIDFVSIEIKRIFESYIDLIGKSHLVIFALGLKDNKLSHDPRLHTVNFEEFIKKFSGFYQYFINIIKHFVKRSSMIECVA